MMLKLAFGSFLGIERSIDGAIVMVIGILTIAQFHVPFAVDGLEKITSATHAHVPTLPY